MLTALYDLRHHVLVTVLPDIRGHVPVLPALPDICDYVLVTVLPDIRDYVLVLTVLLTYVIMFWS